MCVLFQPTVYAVRSSGVRSVPRHAAIRLGGRVTCTVARSAGTNQFRAKEGVDQ
jgi:hypothetical protein